MPWAFAVAAMESAHQEGQGDMNRGIRLCLLCLLPVLILASCAKPLPPRADSTKLARLQSSAVFGKTLNMATARVETEAVGSILRLELNLAAPPDARQMYALLIGVRGQCPELDAIDVEVSYLADTGIGNQYYTWYVDKSAAKEAAVAPRVYRGRSRGSTREERLGSAQWASEADTMSLEAEERPGRLRVVSMFMPSESAAASNPPDYLFVGVTDDWVREAAREATLP